MKENERMARLLEDIFLRSADEISNHEVSYDIDDLSRKEEDEAREWERMRDHR